MSQIKKLGRHVSIYAVAGILSRSVGFIMLPIYTRYLTPEDYGIVALITVMVSVVEGTLGVRLMTAVSKFYYEKKTEDARALILSTAIVTTTIACFAAFGLMVLASESIADLLLGDPTLALVVALFSFALVTQSIEAYGFLYLRMKEQPVKFLNVSVVKLVGQLGLNLIFVVYLEMGVLGLAISQFTAFAVLAIYFLFLMLRETGIRVSREVAIALIIFSWPLWISGFANLYFNSVDKFVLRGFDSLSATGLYGMGQQFAALLAALIWMPFMNYWAVERLRIYNDDEPAEIHQQVFTLATAVMLICAAGVALFSPYVIYIMADPQFLDAWKAVPMLCCAAYFTGFSQFVNLGIIVRSRTKQIAYADILSSVFVTVFLLWLVPSYGIVGAATALAIASVLRFAHVHYVSARLVDMQLNVRAFMLISVLVFGVISFGSGVIVWDDIAIELMKVIAIFFVIVALVALYTLSDTEFRSRIMAMVSR